MFTVKTFLIIITMKLGKNLLIFHNYMDSLTFTELVELSLIHIWNRKYLLYYWFHNGIPMVTKQLASL